MASSSSQTHMKKNEKPTNWAELPPELTSSILLRLGTIDILENAQKVCKPWRCVTKDPLLWRKIDMQNTGDHGFNDYQFGFICRNAVNRSEGGLVEIKIGKFGTDELLNYIADRSSNLRSLGVAINRPSMTNEGVVNAIAKLPLLEELETSQMLSKLNLKVIGHSCPHLKTLKLNCSGYRRLQNNYLEGYCDDEDALAIAASMPELRHLQLIGNDLSYLGLSAILYKCPHLEHLDLRHCFYVVGDLKKKRCLERIKELRHPNDSTVDYPFYITPDYNDSEDFDFCTDQEFEDILADTARDFDFDLIKMLRDDYF